MRREVRSRNQGAREDSGAVHLNTPFVPPPLGAAAEEVFLVTEETTAERFGNAGVSVLATPYLVGALERVAVLAIVTSLRPGESTVGTHIDLYHDGATPVGMRVTTRARLTASDGRRLTFEVEARDEHQRIARGIHERFVIDLKRFLHGLSRKGGPPA